MHHLCWTVCRFATSAWVGAAVLFVVTAVREVRSAVFDSATKNELALLRFPAYYLFGFVLVSLGLVASIGALCTTASAGRAEAQRGLIGLKGAIGLLVVALGIMLADYGWVYRPMAAMIGPSSQAKTDAFGAYHRASEWLNSCDVGLCAFAAILLCRPRRFESADNAGQ